MNNKLDRSSLPKISQAVTELMPNIIRGVQLDLFSKGPITQTQFFMLVAIQASGRVAMSELAENLRIKMPTATGLVNRLVASGYVKRFSDPKDRRKVYVQVTADGTTFFEKFRQVMRKRWEEVLLVLNQEERKDFHRLVIKLKDGIAPGKNPRVP